MGAVRIYETSVYSETTRRHIPECSHLLHISLVIKRKRRQFNDVKATPLKVSTNTCLVTRWSRVLIGKLTVAQLVIDYPAFYLTLVYSGLKITASFGNITVRGEKIWKGQGESAIVNSLSMYSITENIYCSQLSSVAILLQPKPVFTSYSTRIGFSLPICYHLVVFPSLSRVYM
jgi:hypothetical protein